MLVLKEETVAIASDADVVLVRQLVRRHALELRFSLVDQTKLVTAASELARNALEHGRGGELLLQILQEPPRSGLRLVFTDRGPGIANVELAMKDGYTTGGGLGLGLGGAKRLVNEFAIESTPGSGTRVTVTKWR
ncbi:anti-sigma regulatory factor [Anaeromyxobacter sp. Fw109-5]|uniref:anti-sigma regulatory factor n=1 Tax=Anaeromyxobacter sp. (strain Fw109-5) TaxID=404589 RepID=UPI0000ED7FFB|nr:anti-sigma regulatory factor [Anaeromyxobacter sp. Fw109-5]ABS25012.1 putative anti-sigma regulatory factor, serine/threonine protein kinase [Anaeromyxobacter sp. Fw109-5]